MTRNDTRRAVARSLAGVMTGAAMLLVAAGPARAEGEPAGGGVPAAWQVAFDEGARAGQDPPAPAPAPAPTFWQSVEFSGFVDGYYEWAFNESALQLRNFDVNHNTFSLNYAEVALSKAVSDTSRGGFRVDFGAGDTATLVNAFEPGGTDYLKYVQQAYVSYLVPVGKGLTVDFGKFVTPHGAEVIENKDNYNYSRGLLFALAIPYYHAGARLSYAATEKVSVTGYVVNGWNNVRDNNGDKTVGIGLATKPTAKLAVNGTYMVGKEQAEDADGGVRNLVDVVAIYSATDKLSILGNFDYGHDNVESDGVDWYGVAFGAKYQATDKWAFSPRFEIFRDADGWATGTAQTLQDITLTGEYKALGGLIARFEFRTDFSDEDYFVKDSGARVGTQPSLAFGLIYAFSTRQ
jgi:hypothetical protein